MATAAASVSAASCNVAGWGRVQHQVRAPVPFRCTPVRRNRIITVAIAGGPFEKIADKLGDEVYADLNGWRLYLRDMKSDGGKTMAEAVAEQVGSGDSLEAALGNISIKLGGGKKSVSLADVVPDNQIENGQRALEDLDD